jgi:hypothetical protein
MSSYGDRINELRKRVSDIASQLTSLTDKRKSYSLAATEGDERAKKAIADCDFQTDSLHREEQTVNSAIETATALHKQQEVDTERKERHQKEVDARLAAQAIAALNLEIDEALVHLKEIFDRRASLLTELADTQVVDPGLIMRLNHRSGPTASAQLAGLNRFLALEMTPAASVRPLATANEILVRIGAEPEPEPDNRPSPFRPRPKNRVIQ